MGFIPPAEVVVEEIIVHPVAGEAEVRIRPQVEVVPDPEEVAGDKSERYLKQRPGILPGLCFKTTPYKDNPEEVPFIDNPFTLKFF